MVSGPIGTVEFSQLAGRLPWYVIEDADEVREFTLAVSAARGDIDNLPKKWRELMYANRDVNLSDFDTQVTSSYGFDDPDPLMGSSFREMGKPQ
jgi:hypothetical protein